MKVQIEKVFAMPASSDMSWQFLQDIAAVAACMPGAKITERLDDTHYKGTVTVRVGPATMSFRGDIEVRELDAATRTLRLIGKGSDTTGTSGASIDLTARIEAAEGGLSNLVGKSDASVSGKAAAFGGRMMNSVADQVLKQFAANFAAQVESLKAPQAGVAPLVSPPPAQHELNGLALFWAILKDWIRGLFSKQQG
jgi:carbon monoxide dehydrogenase subunit G